MSERIGYLGPPGTFTEEALLSLSIAKSAELFPLGTVFDVIDQVQSGDLDRGMVPIENSIEGSVNVTLDALAFHASRVVIQHEVVRAIRHALLARPDVSLEDIVAVCSHPHATAQCRGFLTSRLPKAEIHAANSTADAAREVAERPEAWAAIGSPLAAELNGLVVLENDIEDRTENVSRFVLLGRAATPVAPSGSDKTSVVCFIEKDRPGSLLAILHEFSDRQINLLKLESRPTKERLGEYCFFIDMEGHAAEPPVSHALASLRTKILEVKVLGSYPRARDA
ncbi:MAG: prephenate dehydratase [Actinomycetota bacterium]|nr:prephenate dehydratase [Actinomycetota bacterium]